MKTLELVPFFLKSWLKSKWQGATKLFSCYQKVLCLKTETDQIMNKLPYLTILVSSLLNAQIPSAPLPEKLQILQENYNAAIARANAPITTTFIKELEKLKTEYTRQGDLKSALVTDEAIKGAQQQLEGDGKKSANKLSEMSESQFKRWLSKVVIIELDSPNGIKYTFDNAELSTMWGDMRAPHVHKTATIEVGRIVVPFTNTVATIMISPTLDKAEISYNTGVKYQASISEKKR